MADYPDPEVGRSMKESIDRGERARAERARTERQDRGDLTRDEVRKVADDLDAWHGKDAYRDPIEEIVERVGKEDAS
jgi:hypothetical protein